LQIVFIECAKNWEIMRKGIKSQGMFNNYINDNYNTSFTEFSNTF